jgi:hypothetical protein
MGRSLPLSDSLATYARASGHADAADARSDVLKTVRRTGAKTTECLPISAGLVLDERVQGSTATLAFVLSVQSTCRTSAS